MVVEILIAYHLVLLGQNTFGLIIDNSVNKKSPFQVWHVLKPFYYGCITSRMFTFHTFELHHGLKICCACPCIVWMVRFHQVSHSNQDTQISIKCYHKALKRWFSLETKGLRGHCINWLVWKLTKIMAQHYMHQAKMKRQGFIKNKVMAWLCGGKCWQN